MFGSVSSPGQLRHSDSSQSINRKMWDSSDPTRNPAPLPLPDNHAPISGIKTQGKVAAAHKRLVTTSSSRSLTQLAQDTEEQPALNLYDLVYTIHTNLEILMKRSQNNARDLGKLRGDVRNPQAMEDIKKLLQESSNIYANVDTYDTEKRKEIESDLAVKLDALLKASISNNVEKSVSSPMATPDSAVMAQFSAAVSSAASAAVSSSQVVEQLDELSVFVRKHLPVHIPEQASAVLPTEPKELMPTKVMIDTSQLEGTVSILSVQILAKVEELQKLDGALLTRRSELATLETRTRSLQAKLTHLVAQITNARSEEELRQRASNDMKERKETDLRAKRSKRATVPSAPVHDRRIVSLGSVSASPRPVLLSTNSSGLAPPIKSDSPFIKHPVLTKTHTNQSSRGNEKEMNRVNHKPMQLTLRAAPSRKGSWSRRVSQIFTPNNKENSLLGSVHEDRSSDASREGLDVHGQRWSTIGRGFAGGKDLIGSMRSFRSFSHV